MRGFYGIDDDVLIRIGRGCAENERHNKVPEKVTPALFFIITPRQTAYFHVFPIFLSTIFLDILIKVHILKLT